MSWLARQSDLAQAETASCANPLNVSFWPQPKKMSSSLYHEKEICRYIYIYKRKKSVRQQKNRV
jgi:hypothetical protein